MKQIAASATYVDSLRKKIQLFENGKKKQEKMLNF